MILQYPHSITVTKTAEPVQDGIGNFTVPTGQVVTSECRAEMSPGSGVVVGVDGEVVSFKYVVYLPLLNTDIPFGSIVVITLENGSVINGFVKAHSNGQLNSRIWV